jgi:hypothetical protein
MKEEKNTECKRKKNSVQSHQALEKQHAFFSLLFAVPQHGAPQLHIDCRAGFDQTTLFPYYASVTLSFSLVQVVRTTVGLMPPPPG